MTAPTYAEYLRARGSRPGTVALYGAILARVEPGTTEPAPEAAVAWIRRYIMESTPEGTVTSTRAAVVHYLAWRDYTLPDPPLLARQRHKQHAFKDALDEAEYATWQALVEASDVPRHVYAILRLLPVLALRIHEACTLRWERYKPDEKQPTLDFVGKGGKPATLPVTAEARDVLETWRVQSDAPARGWIFPSPGDPSKPFTADAVRYHTRRLSDSSDIGKPVTPHVLRHTAATRMLRAGVSLTVVQQILRHESVSMTARYLHPTLGDLATGLGKLDTTTTTPTTGDTP